MAYVDGFVLPIPKKKVKDYQKIAKKAGKVWKEHGALEYYECIGDDVPPGKKTSFPLSVKLKKDEVVFFSWIIYKNRKQRDQVLKKVMADPRMQKEIMGGMDGIDMKRMIYGGFKPIVSM